MKYISLILLIHFFCALSYSMEQSQVVKKHEWETGHAYYIDITDTECLHCQYNNDGTIICTYSYIVQNFEAINAVDSSRYFELKQKWDEQEESKRQHP